MLDEVHATVAKKGSACSLPALATENFRKSGRETATQAVQMHSKRLDIITRYRLE